MDFSFSPLAVAPFPGSGVSVPRRNLLCASPPPATPTRGQLGVGPWPRARLGQAAGLAHVFDRHRRAGVAPFAPHVSQDRRDLLVGQRSAERRHQTDLAFLAGEQDAGGGGAVRPDVYRDSTSGGASFSLPRPSG